MWPPVIVFHTTCALLALLIGPIALWARLGRTQLPRIHRAFGYAWVTLMVLTAGSAVFIQNPHFVRSGGFSPIHLLIPFTLGMLWLAFRALFQGRIRAHKGFMGGIYLGACLIAGGFTLLPGRRLGDLLWKQTLGVM